MIERIKNIIIYSQLCSSDFDGRYEYNKHNDVVTYDNLDYVYHSSGLCRIVFVNKEHNYVLKIPHDIREDENFANWLNDPKLKRFLPIAIKHNLYEGLAYQNAPEKYKKYLAKTELLDNGWLKQEYCDIYKISISHDFREFGITEDFRAVMFDYDKLIFNDRHDVYETPFYECLEPLITKCEDYIKETHKTGDRYRELRINLLTK